MTRAFHIVFLAAVLLAATSAQACSVCFGGSDENINFALQAAIAGLLGVTVTMLGAIAGFAYLIWRRGQALAAQEAAADPAGELHHA